MEELLLVKVLCSTTYLHEMTDKQPLFSSKTNQLLKHVKRNKLFLFNNQSCCKRKANGFTLANNIAYAQLAYA